MPQAGDTIRALDFTPPGNASQTGDEIGFTSTSYIAGTNECATTFIAPTSGRARVMWHVRGQSNSAGVRMLVSVEVREGAIIGSGTLVSTVSDSSAIETSGTVRIQVPMFRDLPGLTPGASYNVRTFHKMGSAGNGDIFDRSIAVTPLP